MSSVFYKSIIEDEVKVFGIKKESLKDAAKSVSKTYSRNALKKGQTFLDYNIPSYRCAYLYKYASLHTGLVTKYFRKLIKKKAIKSSLNKKGTLKICCLGGGPGTDIVGLFKVLSLIPHYHKKVVEVTVLDICGGWRNSFKRIITSLIGGEVKDVPETFVNIENFKFKLIEVNLLLNLPSNIVTVLSEADIVCMVKFVSAILGSSTSVSALQVIGEKLKIGAVVLFIDNFVGNVFKPFADISGQIGLQLILGPVHESFNRRHTKGSIACDEKEMFGCLPLFGTKVTVLGFIKSSLVCNNISSHTNASLANILIDDDDDNSWDTDDESENSVNQAPKKMVEYPFQKYDKITQLVECSQKKHDKFTQTSEQFFHPNTLVASSVEPVPINDLNSLIDKLCELVNILNQYQQRMIVKKHCCHCLS